MSHLTASVSPDLGSPLPHRESRLGLALSSLLAWMKAHSLFRSGPPADAAVLRRSEQRSLGARPMMAAAWYGSLGPGPMCLPGQPAISFDPGYRD
ncbi:hypothetical protein [Hyalangium sp.]|uniref:hypothetical protein n=1 Tax=Hyalangium sp. TaxID=2028555 RepID=UPI002D411E73|nr:hypothetical protein [Hyalangium sp.]HYH99176.1 hypothetical protein [Hyalangium sp.]